MPEYLISDGDELPRFARVDNGKKVVWVDIANATGFATPELARESVKIVCEHMRQKASGEKPPANGGQWKFDTLKKPNWLFQRRRYDDFAIASRATVNDLLGSFELFYVRTQKGWLCRPERKSQASSLGIGSAFSLAVAFSSHEAALAALKAHMRRDEGFIVKSSAVLTQVTPIGSERSDDLMERLSSACERRDLSQAIQEQAQLRLQAIAAAAKESDSTSQSSAAQKASMEAQGESNGANGPAPDAPKLRSRRL